MFKYTPSLQVIRALNVPKTGKWWDKEYFASMGVLKEYGVPQEYTMTVVLRMYYPKVCFYSQTKLKEVPVNGYMFPAEMFTCEKVES